MVAGIEAGDDGINNSRRAAYDVKRRMETVLSGFAGRNVNRIRVGDPVCIHALAVEIARRLRSETTVSLKWIARNLNMGAPDHLGNSLRTAKS